MALWLTLFVVLLVQCSLHASTSDPSLTRLLNSDSRLLKQAPVFCRCEAAFEQLYSDDDANRNLVERELKLYNYEDSYMDSKGYYIVDGVRVLPREECRKRQGRMGSTQRRKMNRRDLIEQYNEDEDNDAYTAFRDVDFQDDDLLLQYDDSNWDQDDGIVGMESIDSRGLRYGKGGKGNGERKGKGTVKVSNSGKSGKGRGKSEKGYKTGKAAIGKGNGQATAKGAQKRNCRNTPFDARCLPPIGPCPGSGTKATDVPTSSPLEQIVPTPTLPPQDPMTAVPNSQETTVPTSMPQALIIETPTTAPQSLIEDTPTSVPVSLLVPTATTNAPTFLQSVVPTTDTSPSPSASPSTQPSQGPSLAACLSCAASNACFATSCTDTGTCIYTSLVTCPPGQSCDALAGGTCRSQNDLRPCVAVIDESSQSTSYVDAKWTEFRTTYPNRPFCLLQPVNSDFLGDLNFNGLYLPPNFLNDTKATHFNITREDGYLVIPNPPLADWYNLCDIAMYAATGVDFVGLFVDVSGSMNEDTVRSMLTNFTTALNRTGLAFKQLYDGYEDWILPFLTDLSTL
jgi:hypothetical protein